MSSDGTPVGESVPLGTAIRMPAGERDGARRILARGEGAHNLRLPAVSPPGRGLRFPDMGHLKSVVGGTALAVLVCAASAAHAQSLGTFTWQLQPFCNRVTVTVTQNGAIYTLDGYDDQCGALQRAPLVGLATPNPDGSIGLGFHIATSPGGKTVSVEARISLATIAGPWTDIAGNSGTLALNGAAAGSARPAPSGGLAWGVRLDGPSGGTATGLTIATPASGTLDPPAIAVAFGTPASVSPIRSAGIVGSTHDGVGVEGLSDTTIGVLGQSQSGLGVAGVSLTGIGTGGVSLAGTGLNGQTSSGTGVLAEVVTGGDGAALDLRNGRVKVSGTVRPAFVHTATAGNTAGHATTIDHPLLNGTANAIVVVTHAYVTGATIADTHVTSVWYDTALSRWRIYHDDNAAMPVGIRFNVIVFNQ